MNEKNAIWWRKNREAGSTAWIIRKGIVQFGTALCMMFFLPILMNDARQLMQNVVYLPVCILGGALFGLLTWYPMEWQYRRYLSKHGQPPL